MGDSLICVSYYALWLWLRKSRAKAHPFEMNRFSAGRKSSSPLLKKGAPTRFGVDYIGGSFSGSHAGAKALTILVGVPRLKSCPDTGRECGHLSLHLAAGVQLISHRNAPGFVYAVDQQDELRRCVGRRHQRCRGIAQRN